MIFTRLTLICFSVSLLLLLPVAAYQYGWDMPGGAWLSIPATGLGYMGVFFHEIGHTVASWSYGYPAIPTFDFQHGGGMTYSGSRSMVLLAAIYAGAASGAFFLYRDKFWQALAAIAILTIFHLATAFNGAHDVVISYMGHGGEIIVAYFCILRGLLGPDRMSMTERVLNQTFGFFTLGRNILLCFSLFDADGRENYAMQKGGHILGDFENIAMTAGIRIETAACLSLLFLVITGVAAFFIAWSLRREQEFA